MPNGNESILFTLPITSRSVGRSCWRAEKLSPGISPLFASSGGWPSRAGARQLQVGERCDEEAAAFSCSADCSDQGGQGDHAAGERKFLGLPPKTHPKIHLNACFWRYFSIDDGEFSTNTVLFNPGPTL